MNRYSVIEAEKFKELAPGFPAGVIDNNAMDNVPIILCKTRTIAGHVSMCLNESVYKLPEPVLGHKGRTRQGY